MKNAKLKLLEVPPSVNRMWRATPSGNGKARNVLSAEGRAWKEAAIYYLNPQKGIGDEKGFWGINVRIPGGPRQPDLDNFSKGILDALHEARKTPDDRYLVQMHVEFYAGSIVEIEVWREPLLFWAAIKGTSKATIKTMI